MFTKTFYTPMKKTIYTTLLLLLTIACSKEPNSNSNGNLDNLEDKNLRAIIISEGQFGYGTGSMTTLSKDGEYINDVFRTINKRPLGDVPQSVTRIGDNYYIPVNNSKKVEVINAKTFQSVETMVLTHNTIPMFVEHLGGDSIIVSDQSGPAIEGSPDRSSLMIMDINHGKDRKVLRRLVEVDSPTFQMKVINNKLFVGSDRLLVYDLDNITSEGERFVGDAEGQPFKIVDFSKLCIDSKGLLWVASENKIICVDPITEKCINTISIAGIDSMWGNIDIDKDGKWLYLNVENKIYSIDTDNPVASVVPIIVHDNNDEGWTTYSIGVSKENTIFIIRAMFGSITRGRVFEYNLDGELISSYADNNGIENPYFKAGIFPHYIYFL